MSSGHDRGTRPLVVAAAYFVACWVVAAVTGALRDLIDSPVIRPGHVGDVGWLAVTAVCLLFVAVAYWVIWPIGTFTLDRRRHVPSVLGYGLAWGISQALLFLSVFHLVADQVDGRLGRVVLTFVVLSAFQGAWHALIYDRVVSPPHNDPAWNLWKVAFCHVPNLLLTLTHLAVYDEPAVFVAAQVIALTGSSWFMRHPDLRALTATTRDT